VLGLGTEPGTSCFLPGEPLPDPPPIQEKYFEIHDDDYKEVRTINRIKFNLYEQNSKEFPDQYSWFAVFKDMKGRELTLRYNGRYSKKADDKHVIPKVFLDFISSIRLKKAAAE
jgi:hypothetical protein